MVHRLLVAVLVVVGVMVLGGMPGSSPVTAKSLAVVQPLAQPLGPRSIDGTGKWNLTITAIGQTFSCKAVAVTQSGSSVGASGTCDAPIGAISFSGIINTTTGRFTTISGSAGLCPNTLTMSGDVSPDGNAMSGSGTCVVPFTFTGSRLAATTNYIYLPIVLQGN